MGAIKSVMKSATAAAVALICLAAPAAQVTTTIGGTPFTLALPSDIDTGRAITITGYVPWGAPHTSLMLYANGTHIANGSYTSSTGAMSFSNIYLTAGGYTMAITWDDGTTPSYVNGSLVYYTTSSGTYTTDQIYALLLQVQASQAANDAAIQTALNQVMSTLNSHTATLSELSTDLANLAAALQAFQLSVANNFSALNAKIDADIATLQAQIAAAEAAREADNTELNAKIDADVAALIALINENEAKRAAAEAALNAKIDANQTELIGRLDEISSALATMQGQLVALQTTVDANNAALNSKIDSNQAALVSQLDEIAAEIESLKAQIAANEAAREADQTTTSSALTNLQSGVSSNEEAIEEMQETLETLQSQVNSYGKQTALQASNGSSATGKQLSTPSTLGFSSSESSNSESNPVAEYDKRINDGSQRDDPSSDGGGKSGGSAKIPVVKPITLLDYLEGNGK